ncbi:MAG: pyridoxamine 5'-phosphate oxidase [Chloroflexota bacterium]
MVAWSAFEASDAGMADAGRRLFHRTETGEALLATVRDGAPPRIHPINVAIVDGRLVAFLLPSQKLTDVARDGRYALHAHQDPAPPDEFSVRGRARVVDDPAERAAAAAVWSFEVDETYTLVEFSIDHAILGRRGADEWPPRYTSWKPQGS